MQQIIIFILLLTLTNIYRVKSIKSKPTNYNGVNLFNDLALGNFFFDNQDLIIDNMTTHNIFTSRNSINNQTNARMTEVYTDELLKLSIDQDVAFKKQLQNQFIRYSVQQEDLKKEKNLNIINLSLILGGDAQQQVEKENKRDLSSNQINIRNLQIQGNTLQNQFDRQYPNSQIEINSQFKFQFDKFGEGQHKIENVIRIQWNNTKDEEKTLPSWLYFDQGIRKFRGQVPQVEENISYQITIKFQNGTNQIIDKFLLRIYKNQGICALEIFRKIQFSGSASGISTIQIREKIYALVTANFWGLYIIEVSNLQQPVQVTRIPTDGFAQGVSMMQIREKIYALVANSLSGLVADSLSGLQVIELTDPQNPVPVSSIHTNVPAYGVSTMYIREKIYALVAIGQAGLQIIDVSYPQNPVIVSIIDTNGSTLGVSTMYIREKIYAFVADGFAGLKIIEVSNPKNSVLVGSIDTDGSANSVTTIEIREKIYALVANSFAGLKIIEVTDPSNPVLAGSKDTYGEARGVSTLINREKIYALVADGFAGLKIIEVSNPKNSVLVGSIDTDGSANSVTTIEIEEQIYALVADAANGLQIIQIKQSLKYRNYFSPISYSQVDTYGLNEQQKPLQDNTQLISGQVKTIEIIQKIYALVANSLSGLQIIELTDPQYPVLVSSIHTNVSAYGVSTMYIREKIYALVAIGQAGLQIIDVSYPQNPVIVSIIDTNGSALGVSTMYIREKIYAFVADGFAGLNIIEVTDPQKPVQVGSIDTKTVTSVSTMQIKEKIYTLVGIKNIIEIIDVSDPQNLVNVSRIITKFENAYRIITIEIREKIYAIVACGNTGLKFIDVNDPKNPVLVSTIELNGRAIDLSIFEIRGKIYVLVACRENGLKIIEVNDPQNPQIISSIEISGLGNKNAVSSINIGEKNYALLSAGIDGLKIIQFTDNIALYPYINSNIMSQIREFNVNLYPIYMNSLQAYLGETILLSLSLIKPVRKQLTSLPYWVSVNYEEKIINFIPDSKKAFEILRYFYYTFSTKVNSSEFNYTSPGKTSEMVVKELIIWGYLDINLHLTKYFNISKDLLLDPSFNKTVIKNILSQYYHEGYFELMMDDFLELNKGPIKQGELQKQFDQIVGKPKVTKKIDFQFSDNTFIDPDGDLLTYTITEVQKIYANGTISSKPVLPPWLSFDKLIRRIYGIPGIEDLGVYTINIQASDKWAETSQNFTISLTNKAPTVQEEIPEEFRKLKLGSKYDHILSENLFYDSDSDPFILIAEIIYTPKGKNTEIKQQLIPAGDFWLNFDSQTRRFTGTPDSTDIGENSDRFNQTFTINITATDIAEASVSKEFNLTVTKLFPKLNNQIKNQIKKEAVINELFEFQFDQDTFNDDNEGNLIYSAVQANGEPLPIWLVFKEQYRKFEGTSQNFNEVKIRLTATDSAGKSVSDEFIISPSSSFYYYLEFILYYGSALISILGMINYRIKIYNIFCQRKYRYRYIEQANVGEKYSKIIPLIKEDMEIAYKLWKKLEEDTILRLKLKSNSKKNWLQLGFMNEQRIDKEKLYEALNQTFFNAKMMLVIMNDQYEIINGMIADTLIKNHQQTYKIYKQLIKESSQFLDENQTKIYSSKDWYRKYINIKIQKNEELKEFQIIEINDQVLENQLSQMNIQSQFDKPLLKEKILAQARGIVKISLLSPSQGEAIHINKKNIKSIKAKEETKEQSGTIRKIMKFLKLDHDHISMSADRNLPKWLQVDLIENNLLFSGTPRLEDKGLIMIEISDLQEQVIKEFFISISQTNQQNFIQSIYERPHIQELLSLNQSINASFIEPSIQGEPYIHPIKVGINSQKITQQIKSNEIEINFQYKEQI